MKKYYIKLFIVAILFMLITLTFLWFSIYENPSTSKTSQLVNSINSEEIIDDVEGYGYLLSGIGAVSYDFVSIIAIFTFILVIPGFILCLIIFSQFIAMLIQIGKEKQWKNTTSKVFTYISIVLQVILCLELLFAVLNELIMVNNVFLLLTLLVNIICVILFLKELTKIKQISNDTIQKIEPSN